MKPNRMKINRIVINGCEYIEADAAHQWILEQLGYKVVEDATAEGDEVVTWVKSVQGGGEK